MQRNKRSAAIKKTFGWWMTGAFTLGIAGCGLPHEKDYDTTPTNQVGKAPEGYGVAVGQPAPDAELLDSSGTKTRLLATIGSERRLVVFYKGGWCPSCNRQIHEFGSQFADFKKRGVGIVAISVDTPAYGAKTAKEYGLPFPLLSDSNLVAHKAYRVVDHIGGFGAFMLARMGANLSERAGNDNHDVAVPSLFLVDKQGIVRFAHADLDYGTRPSTAQILNAIDAMPPE
jgi:peroxiredoxin